MRLGAREIFFGVECIFLGGFSSFVEGFEIGGENGEGNLEIEGEKTEK